MFPSCARSCHFLLFVRHMKIELASIIFIKMQRENPIILRKYMDIVLHTAFADILTMTNWWQRSGTAGFINLLVRMMYFETKNIVGPRKFEFSESELVHNVVRSAWDDTTYSLWQFTYLCFCVGIQTTWYHKSIDFSVTTEIASIDLKS